MGGEREGVRDESKGRMKGDRERRAKGKTRIERVSFLTLMDSERGSRKAWAFFPHSLSLSLPRSVSWRQAKFHSGKVGMK